MLEGRQEGTVAHGSSTRLLRVSWCWLCFSQAALELPLASSLRAMVGLAQQGRGHEDMILGGAVASEAACSRGSIQLGRWWEQGREMGQAVSCLRCCAEDAKISLFCVF